MIFSGCFRRTKTHNPFKHDRFVILVRTHPPRDDANERTNARTNEGRRTGGKPRARVGARARFPRALLRSFVRFRSFDIVAFDFVASVGGVPSVRAVRSGEKVDSTSTKGPSTRGFFAVRRGTDGWDGCRDGRTARDASETSGDARANDEKKEDTARTGGGERRRPGRRRPGRRAMARGVERWRATNQPPVCVSCVVCVCVMCVES